MPILMNQPDIRSLPGMLIIGSAPSGAGKNSIFSAVLKMQKGAVVESVSCTTRSPRPGEVNGVDYYFVSPAQFEEWDGQNYFLEAGGMHDGKRYGTPLGPVIDKLTGGVDVLLVIEVQGAAVARQRVPDALTIFIMPAGDTLAEKLSQLEAQLNKRGQDTQDRVRERLNIAVKEIDQAKDYQFVVKNAPGKLDQAIHEVNQIINNAREKRAARLEVANG